MKKEQLVKRLNETKKKSEFIKETAKDNEIIINIQGCIVKQIDEILSDLKDIDDCDLKDNEEQIKILDSCLTYADLMNSEILEYLIKIK